MELLQSHIKLKNLWKSTNQCTYVYKGGPLDEKKSEKNIFCVWKWNCYLKILIFVEVTDQKVPKNAQNHHNVCFLVLFSPWLPQKSIFSKANFTFNLHFSRRFLKTLIRNDKSTNLFVLSKTKRQLISHERRCDQESLKKTRLLLSTADTIWDLTLYTRYCFSQTIYPPPTLLKIQLI